MKRAGERGELLVAIMNNASDWLSCRSGYGAASRWTRHVAIPLPKPFYPAWIGGYPQTVSRLTLLRLRGKSLLTAMHVLRKRRK